MKRITMYYDGRPLNKMSKNDLIFQMTANQSLCGYSSVKFKVYIKLESFFMNIMTHKIRPKIYFEIIVCYYLNVLLSNNTYFK